MPHNVSTAATPVARTAYIPPPPKKEAPPQQVPASSDAAPEPPIAEPTSAGARGTLATDVRERARMGFHDACRQALFLASCPDESVVTVACEVIRAAVLYREFIDQPRPAAPLDRATGKPIDESVEDLTLHYRDTLDTVFQLRKSGLRTLPREQLEALYRLMGAIDRPGKAQSQREIELAICSQIVQETLQGALTKGPDAGDWSRAARAQWFVQGPDGFAEELDTSDPVKFGNRIERLVPANPELCGWLMRCAAACDHAIDAVGQSAFSPHVLSSGERGKLLGRTEWVFKVVPQGRAGARLECFQATYGSHFTQAGNNAARVPLLEGARARATFHAAISAEGQLTLVEPFDCECGAASDAWSARHKKSYRKPMDATDLSGTPESADLRRDLGMHHAGKRSVRDNIALLDEVQAYENAPEPSAVEAGRILSKFARLLPPDAVRAALLQGKLSWRNLSPEAKRTLFLDASAAAQQRLDAPLAEFLAAHP